MPSVLITGAGRGFGRELCGVYWERGWTTFPLVRTPTAAERLLAEGGAECHPVVADVSTSDAERDIARVLALHGGRLDVLINNAGHIKKLRGHSETTAEDLEELFRVHCVGAFRCVRSALPFLRRSPRAVVVNVSSRWGSIARTAAGKGGGIYSYQIAKCAQNMLAACLDQELRREGVRVLAVHPGRLKTEVGAADADTDPRQAARALADWIEGVDDATPFALHDLMGGEPLGW